MEHSNRSYCLVAVISYLSHLHPLPSPRLSHLIPNTNHVNQFTKATRQVSWKSGAINPGLPSPNPRLATPSTIPGLGCMKIFVHRNRDIRKTSEGTSYTVLLCFLSCVTLTLCTGKKSTHKIVIWGSSVHKPGKPGFKISAFKRALLQSRETNKQ